MNPLPVRRRLTFSYRASLVVAALMAVASGAGLLLGSAGLYGPNPALGVTEAEAGLLLLGSLWLARRGSLVGLLFLPGTLFYALYWYVLYLTGAPFSVLFLVYVPLVTLSAFTISGVVSSTDGEEVRRRLSATVPARAIGALLVVLGLLTLAQDTTGALVSALADDAPADPAARPVWISDLALQAPAVIVGGALLWRRQPLGYVAGAGLLLQYGLSAVGFVAGMVLESVLTGSPPDVATSVVLILFGAVCFVPLAFFIRGAAAPTNGVA